MKNIRELRRRIKSVDGIRQITRAMEMVSATKLRRAQQRIETAGPYTDKMDEILSHLARAVTAGTVHHPLMEPREEIKNVLIIGVASGKGLCGSFNANIIRRIRRHAGEMIKAGNSVTLLLIGKKLYDFFRRRDWEIHPESVNYLNIDQTLTVSFLQKLTDIATDAFEDGEFDRVDMVYTEFHSAIVHKVVFRQFLPIVGLKTDTDEEDEVGYSPDYIFEPDPEMLFSILIPKYARIVMFRMLADSLASEHGVRMNAMHNATDNAQDIIRTLTLQRNKARQTAITKELSEIVGGAEALRG